jgi:hypothetical protein
VFDININTDWDGISPYDIEYSADYTDEEKENTKTALMEVQKAIYNDVINFFPDKKIEGGYLTSWYTLPSIQVGYNSITFLSWQNYINEGSYDESSVDKFTWMPQYDDYDFTK